MFVQVTGYIINKTGLPPQTMIISINTDTVKDVTDYELGQVLVELNDETRVVVNGNRDQIAELLEFTDV